MTPKRWFLAAFWSFVLVMCAKSFYDYNSRLEHEAKPERHWFPEQLAAPAAPAAAEGADVRMIRYAPRVVPASATFTAELAVKNFGRKKAIDIQVRVQPYHGVADSKTQPGPDEIPNPGAADPMENTFRWVEFPDLAPNESATKTLTFPARSDAEARGSFTPQILFQTAKDKS